MTINTLEDLFVRKLAECYDAETTLVDSLDELARNTTNDRLSEGFADHRDETRRHVERVEEAFEAMGRRPQSHENRAIAALDQERTEVEDQVEDGDLLNTYYLGAGVTVERVEMTAYENLLTMAKQLDLDDDVTDPLEANHDEEQSAYRELDAMSTASDLKAVWDRLTS